MACFADITVSQSSVATYALCGGIFDIYLTANLSGKLPVKHFFNRLRIDKIMIMNLWPVFTARCYASAVLAVGLCLSVCLSVTSRSSTETAKHRITQTTPHDSPGTLVF